MARAEEIIKQIIHPQQILIWDATLGTRMQCIKRLDRPPHRVADSRLNGGSW